MTMQLATLSLAFAAGLVSILSPCVLPLLPIVLGTAISEHPLGPVALAGGLALSFLTIGIFVATIGLSIGMDADMFRSAGAILLILAGGTLFVPAMQARLSSAAAPFSAWADTRFGGKRSGLGGQFAVGLLLGAIWTPCVGPTLGAAFALASQGRDLLQVGLTIFMFAIGTATPLMGLGFVSRETALKWRGRMIQGGHRARIAIGIVLVSAGLMTLTNFDRALESVILTWMPSWLSEFQMKF